MTSTEDQSVAAWTVAGQAPGFVGVLGEVPVATELARAGAAAYGMEPQTDER